MLAPSITRPSTVVQCWSRRSSTLVDRRDLGAAGVQDPAVGELVDERVDRLVLGGRGGASSRCSCGGVVDLGSGRRCRDADGVVPRRHQHLAVAERRAGRIPAREVHRREVLPRLGRAVERGDVAEPSPPGRRAADDEDATVGEDRLARAEQVCGRVGICFCRRARSHRYCWPPRRSRPGTSGSFRSRVSARNESIPEAAG